MSILDYLPALIRLPLRAVFGIISLALIAALCVGTAMLVYYVATGAWWVYITYDVVFWTVNSLVILVALAIIGAWLEN